MAQAVLESWPGYLEVYDMNDICETPSNFTLPHYLTNQSHSLQDYSGKAILLSFMCIRCGWCWTWAEHMQSLYNDFVTNNDVQVIGVMYNYLDGAQGSFSGQVTKEWIEDKLATYSLNVDFPLLMDNLWNSSIAKQYMNSYAGPVGFPFSLLISMDHKIANKWHRLSTSNGEPVSFDSSDYVDTEYFVNHRLDDLANARDPWDTVLVLDYSGSMASNATIGGTTQPKIEFLKEAVDTYLKVWKDYAQCSDNAGVVEFRSHAGVVSGLQPILSANVVGNMLAGIHSTVPSGCTAMGAGIATALDMLEQSQDRRFSIVFTDGMQNRNPLVYIYEDPMGCLERHIDNIGPSDYPPPLTSLCGPDGGQSNYQGQLPVNLDDPQLMTNIHTIGVGILPDYEYILGSVSAATTGAWRTATEIWPTLKEFFIETLVEQYRGGSLQIVAKRQGEVTPEAPAATEGFLLNRSVKKMTAVLSWLDEGTPLRMRLLKDGREIDIGRFTADEPTYQRCTLRFPHYQRSTRYVLRGIQERLGLMKPVFAGQQLAKVFSAQTSALVDPDGGWEIVVEPVYPDPQGSVPYHLMVLADDNRIEYSVERLIESYYAGETITLQVTIGGAKRPVKNVYGVKAVVHKPKAPIEDYLKEFADRVKPPEKKEEAHDVDERGYLLDQLLNDPSFLREIEPVREEIDLSRKRTRVMDGVHVFREAIKDTAVPGIYRVDYVIRGSGPETGVFERTETRTYVVKPERLRAEAEKPSEKR